MPSPVRRARSAELSVPRRRLLLPVTVLAGMLCAAMVIALGLQPSSSATTGVLTPGTFTGMGFDACAAPSATTMDKWMKAKENPYRAVGVYISGGMRACSQPNLTASWISHVTSTGWHVLPLTVGPQASCTGFSKRVSDKPADTYAAARAQGRAEAATAVATAASLGIAARSTLYYDMESWHTGYDDCDASTLWFLSAWTSELHRRGYTSGVYSSASTGIRLLDKIASAPPTGYVNPDHIWFAQWNDKENTATTYINTGHWINHQRVHQFYGGHKATNGGVTINIDSNWLDVTTPVVGGTPAPKPTPTPTQTATPKPTPTPTATAPAATPTVAAPAAVACTRARVSRTSYPNTSARSSAALVIAAQCLLHREHLYTGKVDGVWTSAMTTALRSFQRSVKLPQRSWIDNRTWTALLSAGFGAKVHLGSKKPVHGLLALARALNAAAGAKLHGTGYFGPLTKKALVRYQRAILGKSSGVANARTWKALHNGRVLPLPKKPAARTEAGRMQPRVSVEPTIPAATATPGSTPTTPSSAQPTPSADPTSESPASQGTEPPATAPPVAAGAGDPALSATPSRRISQRSIGVKAPVHKAAPALPKAHQLAVPRMVPKAATATPVRTPLFSTVLQSRMWSIMDLLDSRTREAVTALLPWLSATESVDGS